MSTIDRSNQTRLRIPGVSGSERGHAWPRSTCTRHPPGSGGIWERLHYDWSDPNHVVLTTDSNTWGGASGHTYTFTRRPDGLTDIDVVVVRDGKNFKGRLLGFMLGTTVNGIEARNSAAREARSS